MMQFIGGIFKAHPPSHRSRFHLLSVRLLTFALFVHSSVSYLFLDMGQRKGATTFDGTFLYARTTWPTSM